MNHKLIRASVVGVIGSLGLTATARPQAEQWLQYKYAAQAREMFQGNIGRQEVKLSPQRPEGVVLPQDGLENALFGQWSSPLSPKGPRAVMVSKGPKSSDYNRIIIDSNGDGRLDDEKPVNAFHAQRHSKEYYQAEFGPVKMVLTGDDGPVTYHLNFNYWQNRDNKNLSASAAGWYEGSLTLAGREYFCVLADMNANGAFNDKSLNIGQCDRIHIGAREYDDYVFVGNFLQLENQYYQLEAAADGAFVKLTPATSIKFGAVKVQPQITDFRAGGENGLFKVKLDNGVGQLPVGTYRVERWSIDKKDDKGRKWKLTGQWFDDKGDFEVKADAAAEPAVGEPIQSAINAEPRSGGRDFRHELKGRLGERIELTCDGNRPSAPRFAIRSESGDYEKKFTLEYG
jgi:hypothetical protein